MSRAIGLRSAAFRAAVPLIAAAALAGCGEGSALAPEATCVAVVKIDGVLYGTPSVPPVDPADLSDVPYAVVTRNTGCLDEGQGLTGPFGGRLDPPGSGGAVTTGSTLAPGESNFLAAGTELYAVSGFEPAERLVFWASVVQEWHVLEPWPSAD